jgi:hypothetical protein
VSPNINNSPLSVHDVRRLAPASVFVTQHNGDKPSIAAHGPKVVPAANAVLVAIQELDQLRAKQVALLAASSEQTAVLHGVMLEWSSHLEGDLPGFEREAFTRDANLAFDVVQTAKSLMQFVEREGVDLPYREALLTELTARIDSTSGAAESAQVARNALQEQQREVRELTVRFNTELVKLRRTVRAALGSRHFDYQRLRVTSRAAAEPPSDEAPVAVPSETETDDASDPSTTT